MKKNIFLVYMLFVTINCNAQFLKGFIYGMGQALENAARQQSYNQRSQQKQQDYQRNREISNYKESKKIEEDGFEWIMITQDDSYYGAKSINGSTLIPLSKGYNLITYHSDNGYGYFSVEKNGNEGIFTKSGSEIISVNRGYSFVCFHSYDGHIGYFSVEKNGKKGICDLSGKEIIPCNYKSIFFSTTCFVYKNNSGDYVDTNVSLDASGHGITLTSVSSSRPTSTTSKSSSAVSYMDCTACKGTGNFLGNLCNACSGSGRVILSNNPSNTPVTNSIIQQNNGSSTTSTGKSTTNKSVTTSSRTQCSACHGTGKKIVETMIATFGIDTARPYCDICKCYTNSGYSHAHVYCAQCHGKGWY